MDRPSVLAERHWHACVFKLFGVSATIVANRVEASSDDQRWSDALMRSCEQPGRSPVHAVRVIANVALAEPTNIRALIM
jgi:hypothetical protein